MLGMTNRSGLGAVLRDDGVGNLRGSKGCNSGPLCDSTGLRARCVVVAGRLP